MKPAMKITKKLATKLHEEKKVEVKVENFLSKVFKRCPKSDYPFPQYLNPHHPNLPICVICEICGFPYFIVSAAKIFSYLVFLVFLA
jgi:abortive infection bacteriophage resistance protein